MLLCDCAQADGDAEAGDEDDSTLDFIRATSSKAPCTPQKGTMMQHDSDDLLDLADEIRKDNPALSLDQALDAAALERSRLRRYAADWEARRIQHWLALLIYARAWDRRGAAPTRQDADH